MTTNIKQLLSMPIGQRWGGDDFTIKIAGKKVQEVNKEWTQHIVLSDKTGEIDVDVNIRRNIPLIKGGRIHIVVSEIQSATNKIGKKLYVDQFTQPTQTVDEYQSKQDEIDKETKLIVESKVRCWLVSASIQGKDLTKAEILEWQEFVLTGEL